jgi:hypothetical protein
MKVELCLYTAVAALTAASAFAQGPRSRARIYDPATEATIKGTVEQITQPSRGQMSGTHLFVKTENATVEVALGPSSFVSSKGFSFAKGDAVEVTGSKVTVSGKEYVIAREVTKDGKTLTLRDKNGVPEWAGRGGRRG